jgi:hypothetical protein
VKPGFFNNIRAPKRKSCRNVFISSTPEFAPEFAPEFVLQISVPGF